MSIINSVAHALREFVSGESKAFDGQRLSVVTYRNKTGADQVAEYRKSKCVSVPRLSDAELTESLPALLPVLRSVLEGYQDKIVRARDLAGASLVTGDEIGITGILTWLAESDSEGNRLTKESVGVWFAAQIEEELTLTIALKLCADVDTASSTELRRIEGAVKEIREKICALAGGKTSYEPAIARLLLKAIAMAPSGDSIAQKFEVRLTKMAERKEESLLDLL